MQNRLLVTLLASLGLTLLTSGCATKPKSMLSFPATDQVQITFQEADIPADCRVFSHRLTFTTTGSTGRQIQQSLTANARANGADMVLVGLVREQLDDELEETEYLVYGPSSPYLFQSRWSGWKYGFRDWRKQGEIIDFGVNALQDDVTRYRQGLIMQNIYLTCRPLSQSAEK